MSDSDVSQQLDSISRKLITSTSLVHAPKKPQDTHLTATIADLHVHPTIEALLHILNHDLPSAHFLVRHMQAPPAVEGMLLHSILHRAEGDFNNARAWMHDVSDACEGYQPKYKAQGQKLDPEVFQKIGSNNNSQISGLSLVKFVYGDEDAGHLVDAVETFRKQKRGQRGRGEEEERDIEQRIRGEAEKVLDWCRGKFGSGVWRDATGAWVRNSEEIGKISASMVSGGKGYRDF
ncbi:hypothetical protein COCC4DRAFT_71049 [Bipolaris maydis ATCC 48331]|uniref:Uncharacterized protein n=2 Tax=Cochliobolus heterostrophus TaxID=5016 RepID=M2SQN9_COCH5|nr:uncharacterized protein COCC4DRAFT_71049 [Bipolaris maydis ATCC 48331]EMD87640.1 hypothetical protein COCHEDRAFT_1184905 [Bipolaris maydis C5]KAH7555000.1 hypothetical protein BM1_07661 [Bipolaris maydis]ENI06839.1 hypothetical protein COCC4DRAFT_71049 [Bipolaris maydis ATCC 48331]KAJ5023099.1 hypothetical protein J3E73DRAFT_400463 [Bipolaris maydis]KAJ5056155.1 hypothetical protein J3E74DRAFT_441132 [Bipolaris maydis]